MIDRKREEETCTNDLIQISVIFSHTHMIHCQLPNVEGLAFVNDSVK